MVLLRIEKKMAKLGPGYPRYRLWRNQGRSWLHGGFFSTSGAAFANPSIGDRVDAGDKSVYVTAEHFEHYCTAADLDAAQRVEMEGEM